MSLLEKVALITGGSQGIGRQYAFTLAEKGAKIVIADINQQKGYEVVQELLSHGHAAVFVEVDVSNEESAENMAREAMDQFGRIDILVNNAAVFSTIKMKPFEEISLDEWNLVMNVNLTGVFLCCKAVVPYMRKQKTGRIINISSDVILSGKSHFLHYVSSKAGVLGLTRALAREVGPDHITCNAIAPGPVVTEIKRETTTKSQDQANLEKQCIHRPATPEDMVGMLSFLCSDEASFITGQLIAINGGKEMH